MSDREKEPVEEAGTDYSVDEDGVRPGDIIWSDGDGDEAGKEQNEETEDGPELDDNDELVEMRGEGRYFGTGEEVLGPICRNCHGRGHIAKDCKVVICDVCGEKDDHYTKQCPRSQKCSNCGQPGHLRSMCQNKSRYIFCSRCESRLHTEAYCPLIWRSYKKNRAKDKYPDSISCYNCASRSHYGDDCPNPRRIQLRFVEKSAFNGENLARSVRHRYRVDKDRYRHRSGHGHGHGNGGSSHNRRRSRDRGIGSSGSKFGQRLSRVKDHAKRMFKSRK